jgi:hypothetical protein
VRSIASRNGKPAGKPRQLSARRRWTGYSTSWASSTTRCSRRSRRPVFAERDLRVREAAQIKGDLSAIYEVLERNRRDREPRLALLVR